jgi:2-dehydropantoate 2-reductase
MRIAVMGAGAVGCFLGGKLALAGEEVVFIARGERLRALSEARRSCGRRQRSGILRTRALSMQLCFA